MTVCGREGFIGLGVWGLRLRAWVTIMENFTEVFMIRNPCS